jgi:PAN domain
MPARAEIVQSSVGGAGKSMTQAECAAIDQAVWINALGRNFCIRYYLSTAGAEGPRPVVILQGDAPDPWDEDTADLFKFADRISLRQKTTGIYLARVGRDGSSGSHAIRHTVLELRAENAALDAIKRRYGYQGFNVYGHSGGGNLAAGLLELRSDIPCDVPADGQLAALGRRNVTDPALQIFEVAEAVSVIARSHARVLVVTDPQDTVVHKENQLPFAEKLKKAGGQVEQFFVTATDAEHHFTTPHAEVAMARCLRNATHEEIAADLAQLDARLLAAKLKAQAAKADAAKAGTQPQTTSNQPPATPATGGLGALSAEPAPLLTGVNLSGMDYASFWIDQAEPIQCQNACRADSKCAAWTYVQPGRQGAQARCWLKRSVPQQTQSSCCTSGIERGEGGAAKPEAIKAEAGK